VTVPCRKPEWLSHVVAVPKVAPPRVAVPKVASGNVVACRAEGQRDCPMPIEMQSAVPYRGHGGRNLRSPKVAVPCRHVDQRPEWLSHVDHAVIQSGKVGKVTDCFYW
jgi:hypothetical protein